LSPYEIWLLASMAGEVMVAVRKQVALR